MDAELKHYLADAPPSVVRLEIEKHFEPLGDKQKRYAHFISRLVGPVFRSHVTSSIANLRRMQGFLRGHQDSVEAGVARIGANSMLGPNSKCHCVCVSVRIDGGLVRLHPRLVSLVWWGLEGPAVQGWYLG